MSAPRPTTKCRRCRFAYEQHQQRLHCPDGSGRGFQRHTESRVVLRFGEGELATLETVLRNALHAGGSAHELLELLGRVRASRQRACREAKAS